MRKCKTVLALSMVFLILSSVIAFAADTDYKNFTIDPAKIAKDKLATTV